MGSFFSYPFWNNIRAKVNILTTLHFHQKQAMLIHLKLGLLVFGRLAPKDWWVKALIGGRLGLSRGFSIAPGNCAPAKVSFYSHNSPCSNSPRTPSDWSGRAFSLTTCNSPPQKWYLWSDLRFQNWSQVSKFIIAPPSAAPLLAPHPMPSLLQ